MVFQQIDMDKIYLVDHKKLISEKLPPAKIACYLDRLSDRLKKAESQLFSYEMRTDVTQI